MFYHAPGEGENIMLSQTADRMSYQHIEEKKIILGGKDNKEDELKELMV